MGRPADAIRELEIAARQATGHNSRMEAYLGYAYAAAGRARDARGVLKELEAHRQDQYVSWYGIALIHDALGEKSAGTGCSPARIRGPSRRIRIARPVRAVQDDRIGTGVPGRDAQGRTLTRLAFGLWLLALSVGTPDAQQDQGMIAGRVTDPTGAIVPAVTVTATADTGVAIQTRTNADGHYVLAPLVIGLYRVSIEVPGFRRAVSDVDPGSREHPRAAGRSARTGSRQRYDFGSKSGSAPPDRHVLPVAHDRRFADRSAADKRPELFAAGDALRRSAARVRPRSTGVRVQQ